MSPHPREPLASRSSLSATYFGFVQYITLASRSASAAGTDNKIASVDMIVSDRLWVQLSAR